MPCRPSTALACSLAVLLASAAGAQTVATVGPGGGPGLRLESLNGGDVFSQASPFDPVQPVRSVVNASVGFSYLRPFWDTSGLNLQAPVGGNASILLVEPFGNLSNDFGFVPRLDLQYDTAALGFGVATSFQFINVGGNLERTVAISGGAADLTATSELAILTINLVEFSKPFALAAAADHPLVAGLGLEDDTLAISIGSRYASIRQSWNATLRGAAVLASTDATQNFAGLGVTSSLFWDHPVGERWGVYSNTRGSVLLGQNNRKSGATGVTTGGAAFNNSLVENRTAVIPVGELEVGVRWLTPLNENAALGATGPLLSVRVGFVGQLWGNVGYLPAAAGEAEFNDKPLAIAGVTLTAGLEY